MGAFLSGYKKKDLHQAVKLKFDEILKDKDVEELMRYYEEILALRSEYARNAAAKKEPGEKDMGVDVLSQLIDEATHLAIEMGFTSNCTISIDYSILVDAMVEIVQERVERNRMKPYGEDYQPI